MENNNNQKQPLPIQLPEESYIYTEVIEDVRDLFCYSNENDRIADMIVLDIHKRSHIGYETYGTFLQAFNGRSAVQDFLEELLDGILYLRQMVDEGILPPTSSFYRDYLNLIYRAYKEFK